MIFLVEDIIDIEQHNYLPEKIVGKPYRKRITNIEEVYKERDESI